MVGRGRVFDEDEDGLCEGVGTGGTEVDDAGREDVTLADEMLDRKVNTDK
jgi:hypothetical protein